jgi:hypothetical protein
MFKNRFFLAIVLLTILISSCKKKEDKEIFDNVQGNYFSIKQYELDQWNTWQGEPFLISKTVTVNKRTDSSLTNSDTISWAPILKAFGETDISDRSFLGKYNFNQFDDNQDGTHNFFYQAKEGNDDLFTRKLLITIDQSNNKVRGIYIETFKKYFGGEETSKLYYNPMKTIQIQTDERPMLGSKKLTVTEWTFQR